MPNRPSEPEPPVEAPVELPVMPESALPHLPGAWLGSEVFEDAGERLAAAERFFCTFDQAPRRCLKRKCRQAFACLSEAPAGEIHRLCRGRPGAHVRHWVVGLWAAHLHDLVTGPCEAEDGAPASVEA